MAQSKTRKKKAKTTAPKPVEAITHTDKRRNLPTADAQEFVRPEDESPKSLRYPRDPALDPQLVWKGKDELDGEDLVADAPPIYIQEKIDPRVLVENLRDTAERPEDEPELTLFESFDGLSELDLVEFYKHDANWSNRMILGDSFNVMASLAEREALRGKVQMIYMDPPYGIKFGSNWQVSARKRDVKDGKLEDASREVEQIKAFRDTWELGIHSYLAYLRDRLTVAKNLLTESGSVFVQIGDENMHLVRSLLDEVFGSENFVQLIPFRKKTMPLGGKTLEQMYDFLLWYAVDAKAVKFRQLYLTQDVQGDFHWNWYELPSGECHKMTPEQNASHSLLPEDARVYRLVSMYPPTYSSSAVFPFEFEGRSYTPPPGSCWITGETTMRRLAEAGRLQVEGEHLRYRLLLDDGDLVKLTALWSDTIGARDQRFVVETSPAVVQRCLLMTTDPGDLVIDPTCGSGTTAYVAEQWGRRWITIDTSRVALALARQRLMGAKYPYYLLADTPEGREKEGELAGETLPAAKTAGDIRNGFVYERVQHITLKSIANNPDIREDMPREEIGAAIRRHADQEVLFDSPYEDKRKVRVAGPLTVESLSPHRSLAFAGGAVAGEGARNVGEERALKEELLTEGASRGDAQFEQTILANLRTAGIQNGRKGERLELETLEPYAATHIHAIGERDSADDGSPRRVGISIGPQYGTVGPGFIKDAAREANKTDGLDLLCVLGFAFDPAVVGASDDDYLTSEDGFANVAAERQLGKVPVLLVRMNADLVMGEELKKTGAGNLFTVFGEPDIEIERGGDELRVILRGVDVYDPNTGELRSSETDQIALWMIDTAYNGESFFVRQCYFTGGQDPYKRLKAALKAEIDLDAWATLYATESRPFPRPESGKIAVKVINDYGDEVVKVFEV